jgi:hypothetical protein
MPLTTVLAFYTGTSFEEATRTEAGPPPVVPADYAFLVWTVIYGGSLGYAVFQALPRRRANPLMRRVGYWTASAFLGTSAWLVMARFNLVWMTVVCIVWMLASLAPAFREIVRWRPRLSAAERVWVRLPLSVFTGWVTVAMFANTACAVKASGWENVGLPESAWAVAILLLAGLLGSGVTLLSRGNVGYALTLVWALVAVAVANVTRDHNPTLAAVAVAMAVAVALALVAGRRLARASAFRLAWERASLLLA